MGVGLKRELAHAERWSIVDRLQSPGFRAALVVGALGLITLVFFWQLLGDKVFSRGDIQAYFVPYRDYAAEALRSGQLPLWNPYLFCGAPFLANIQTALFYPLSIPFYFLPPYTAVAVMLMLHSFLAGLFMYLCMGRVFGLRPLPALFSGVVFAFSGFMAVQMVHLHYIGAAIWLPLALLCLHRLLVERRRDYIVWLSLVLAVEFFSGGTQLSYYSLAVLGAYWVLSLVKEGRGAIRWYIVSTGIAVILTVGLSAVQLLPTYELMRESIRAGGVSYAESSWWSIHPAQFLLTLFFPAFFGSQVLDAGSAIISETTSYVGIIPLFLGLVAVLVRPRPKLAVFTLVLAAVAVFFAFGEYNPLARLAYDYLPGFKLFRVPGRALYVYTFAFAVLSGMGLGILQRGPTEADEARILKACRLALGGLVAIALAFVLVHFVSPAGSLIAERTSLLRPANYQPVLAAILGLVLILAALKRPDLRPAVCCSLIAIVAIDLYLFSRNAQFSAPTDLPKLEFASSLPSSSTDLYRVAKPRNWFSNILMSQRIMEAGGYDGGVLPLGRWRELEDTIPENSTTLLALLNVKYVLELPGDEEPVHYFEFRPELRARSLGDPLPRAFIVHRSEVVRPDEVLATMASPDFDPAETVFLESGPALSGSSGGGRDEVSITSYAAEVVRLRATLGADGFLILTDTYYPGWQAKVDGVPAEILRADYLFRAVPLGPGSHEIEFRYVPASFYLGAGISSFTVLTIFLAGIYFAIRSRRLGKLDKNQIEQETSA